VKLRGYHGWEKQNYTFTRADSLSLQKLPCPGGEKTSPPKPSIQQKTTVVVFFGLCARLSIVSQFFG